MLLIIIVKEQVKNHLVFLLMKEIFLDHQQSIYYIKDLLLEPFQEEELLLEPKVAYVALTLHVQVTTLFHLLYS